MPLFGHRHDQPGPGAQAGVPGLAEAATAQGWQPAGTSPFTPQLAKTVHEITRTLYGVPRRGATFGYTAGETKFSDAFRGSIDGRTVIVANAWTYLDPVLGHVLDRSGTVAVCAVELPMVLPVACVAPRRFSPWFSAPEMPTGNPAFDGYYWVTAGMPGSFMPMLTPEVQQRIMAHDDWVFWAEDYWLACVSKGSFGSAEQVSQRIAEVLGIVTAIPESALPHHVDHSQDDLIARISRLESVEDAIAFLQQLTPADREQLAHSDTPLAAFADVTTPEEAIARFESLDDQRKMALLAMFMRVEDSQGGR
jgi:hypothetical protein